MVLRVDLEAMAASAVHVTNQGEDLAVGHMATDSRIAGAAVGWRGTSAQAIGAKLGAWTNTSTILLGRLSDHAQDLHTCVSGFSTHEEQSRDALQAVAQSGGKAAS